MRNEFVWTDAACKRLEILWREGYIGKDIAKVFGLSRNAVMGKLRRLGLLGLTDRPQNPPAKRLQPPRPRKPPVEKHVDPGEKYFFKPPPVPERPIPEYGKLELFDLKRNSCRWPSDGDSAPWTFCGRPVIAETSYCPEHHSRAHSPHAPRPLPRISA
jgi:hypothetical protein